MLGSINMDLVAEVKRLPTAGETVRALRLDSYPGGKGANQAVAASRLGGRVRMLGKVGADSAGDVLLRGLSKERVDISLVEREAGHVTGTACVWVAEGGENSIVFAAGANSQVGENYVSRAFSVLASARVVLLQLEIPLATVACVLRELPRPGPTVILDPAPAVELDPLPLGRVDILTPNRGELSSLTGVGDQHIAARRMLEEGVACVICKNGEEGCRVFSAQGSADHKAFRVTPVDTTAAGDAFNGALAVMLADGRELEEAVRWANAAGALAATRRGAQPSLPARGELWNFLNAPSDDGL